MKTSRPAAAIVAASLLIAACGGDDPGEEMPNEPSAAEAGSEDEETGDPEGTPDDVPDGEESASDAAKTAYPVTVEGCGVEFTYDEAPQAVVATDTSALETLIDLGLGDRVVGWFGSPDIVADERRDEVAELEHLGDAFPYPALEAVLAPGPDLVFTYGLSEESGLTAERLAEEGMGMYSFVEACPNHTGVMDLEVFYEQVQELGDIFDVRTDADALVDGWRERVEAAAADADVDVFLQGSFNVEEPFTIGANALVHDVITSAGGTNVFADVDEGFFSPTWEDVVSRQPRLIAASEDAIAPFAEFAEDHPALRDIPAVQDANYVELDYIRRVPGPQIIDGVVDLAEAIEATDG